MTNARDLQKRNDELENACKELQHHFIDSVTSLADDDQLVQYISQLSAKIRQELCDVPVLPIFSIPEHLQKKFLVNTITERSLMQRVMAMLALKFLSTCYGILWQARVTRNRRMD